jgi:hypothetical protein
MKSASSIHGKLPGLLGTCRAILGIGGEGGILTQPLSPSYHVFSDMHKDRINIGDFCDLACFNSFNCSA